MPTNRALLLILRPLELTGRCIKDGLGYVLALVVDEGVGVVANLLIEKAPGPLPLCPVFLAEIRQLDLRRALLFYPCCRRGASST